MRKHKSDMRSFRLNDNDMFSNQIKKEMTNKRPNNRSNRNNCLNSFKNIRGVNMKGIHF